MPQNSAIKNYIENIRKRVNLAIRKVLPQGSDKVSRAMRHAVLNGGKRLRPVLFLTAFESLGGKIDSSLLNVASAIEFIHTFSLIQDDLPSMDNDDYRRGKPTVHKAFGEDIAILASDSLLNEAYRILAAQDSIDPGLKIKVVLELTRTVTILISGQEKDLALISRKPVSLCRLNEIYSDKTAALLAACLKIAGILRNIGTDKLKRLNSFGMKLGLAYQIQDDILNLATNDKAFKGKRFSDQRKGKITYVSVAGIQKSREIAENLINQAKGELARMDKIDKEKLYSLGDFIGQRTY